MVTPENKRVNNSARYERLQCALKFTLFCSNCSNSMHIFIFLFFVKNLFQMRLMSSIISEKCLI